MSEERLGSLPGDCFLSTSAHIPNLAFRLLLEFTQALLTMMPRRGRGVKELLASPGPICD